MPKRTPLFLFMQKHPLVDPIEVVGLGGGAIVRREREVNVRVALHSLLYRRDRQGVIGVGADEELDARVIQLRRIVVDHPLDDSCVPSRRRRRFPLAGAGHCPILPRWACGSSGSGKTSIDVADDAGHINEQVIEAVEQYPKSPGAQAGSRPNDLSSRERSARSGTNFSGQLPDMGISK